MVVYKGASHVVAAGPKVRIHPLSMSALIDARLKVVMVATDVDAGLAIGLKDLFTVLSVRVGADGDLLLAPLDAATTDGGQWPEVTAVPVNLQALLHTAGNRAAAHSARAALVPVLGHQVLTVHEVANAGGALMVGAALLHNALVDSSRHAAELSRALAEMRTIHQRAQIALGGMRNALHRHRVPEHYLSLTLHPASDGKTLAPPTVFHLRQRLPVDSSNLAGVGLHFRVLEKAAVLLPAVAKTTPTTAPGEAVAADVAVQELVLSGTVTVTIISADAPAGASPLGRWVVPYQDFRTGWRTFLLQAVPLLPCPRVDVVVEWSIPGDDAPSLSVTSQLLRPHHRAVVEAEDAGGRSAHTLALRLYEGVTGLRLPISAHQQDVAVDIERGPTLLSDDVLSAASLLHPIGPDQAQRLAWHQNDRSLLLHPYMGGESWAFMAGAVPAAARTVRATVYLKDERAAPVEFSMLVLPAGRELPTDAGQDLGQNAGEMVEWVTVLSGEEGALVLELSKPATGPFDLYIGTRMHPDSANDWYAHAMWRDFLVEFAPAY